MAARGWWWTGRSGDAHTSKTACARAAGVPVGHGPGIIGGGILLWLDQLHVGRAPQVSLSTCEEGDQAGGKGELHFPLDDWLEREISGP